MILKEKKNETKELEKKIEKKLVEYFAAIDKKIQDIQKSFSNSENDKNKAFLAFLEQQKKEFEDKNEKLKNENILLYNNLSDVKVEKKELQTRLCSKEDYLSELSANNDRLEGDLKELKKVNNDLLVQKDIIEKHNKELQKTNESLEKEIVNKDIELQKQLEKLQSVTQECSILVLEVNEKKNEIIKLKEEIVVSSERIEEIDSKGVPLLEKAYSLFTSLTEQTRNNIRAIFETGSFLGFISNSMQWDNIASIREQAKRKIVNEDKEDIDALRQLFLVLVDIYNAGYNDEVYKLIKPDVGRKYDSENSLIIGNKSDGIVKKVLLEGYIKVRNNAVVKALVQVE